MFEELLDAIIYATEELVSTGDMGPKYEAMELISEDLMNYTAGLGVDEMREADNWLTENFDALLADYYFGE